MSEQHAADSIGEEVPLIDTGLPNTEEYDMEIARAPSFKNRKRSKLGLLPLVALIFYEVSGGPFGTEVRTHETPSTPTMPSLCSHRFAQCASA